MRTVVLASTALLSACGPVEVSSHAKIEAHRAADFSYIRGADACVDEISRRVGYAETAALTLKIDQAGAPRVEAVAIAIDHQPAFQPSLACNWQIQAAIASWRYRPFEWNGLAVTARITEEVVLIPAERWQIPGTPFPQVDDISSSSITLRRNSGIVSCVGDRPANYELTLRGDGSFTLTEFAEIERNSTPRQTRDGRVDPGIFANLLEQFRAAHFFSLQSEYWSGWQDVSGQTLILEIGDQRAEVRESMGESAGLPLVVRDLQAAVDRAAGLEPLQCAPDRDDLLMLMLAR